MFAWASELMTPGKDWVMTLNEALLQSLHFALLGRGGTPEATMAPRNCCRAGSVRGPVVASRIVMSSVTQSVLFEVLQDREKPHQLYLSHQRYDHRK